jgi:putative ABC transport system substrate-binding protein
VNKKIAALIFTTLILTGLRPAQAQQEAKIHKIGFLGVRPDDVKSTFELFRQQVTALGYVDGKNIAFEYRNAENKPDRLPALVEELIRLKVDVLVVAAANEARAAKNATKTIPIVGLNLSDPVALGLIDSFAHPGANLTGFTPISGELGGKRLELLKETITKLSRVAVLWDPKAPSSEKTLKEIQLPASALGLQLHSMEVIAAEKLESAFKQAIKAGSDALTVNLSPMINSKQRRVAELAAKYRLPAIYPRGEFVQSGGLMSYGAVRTEVFKRVAVMVDKILKGTKPADIPVEQPTKFEFIINLKAAKQIGLTVPPNVLVRADRVIK